MIYECDILPMVGTISRKYQLHLDHVEEVGDGLLLHHRQGVEMPAERIRQLGFVQTRSTSHLRKWKFNFIFVNNLKVKVTDCELCLSLINKVWMWDQMQKWGKMLAAQTRLGVKSEMFKF